MALWLAGCTLNRAFLFTRALPCFLGKANFLSQCVFHPDVSMGAGEYHPASCTGKEKRIEALGP